MKRDAFLGRVRKALHRNADDPVAAPPAPLVPAGETQTGDVLEIFLTEAEAAGWVVHHAADIETAADAVRDLLEEIDATSWVASADPIVNPVIANLELPMAKRVEAADVGITGARCAIARTGTVVLTSEGGRLAGLLPMHHVALVKQDDVVHGMTEAFERFAGGGSDLPTAWVQVTGPSRTADIELTLTTGVHGPGHVTVIVVG